VGEAEAGWLNCRPRGGMPGRETQLQKAQSNEDESVAARSGSTFRQNWYALFVLAILCIGVAPFFSSNIDPRPPVAVDGIVSFAGRPPLDRPVTLGGEWRFQWKSSLGTVPTSEIPAQYMRVPGYWEGRKSSIGARFPGQGRADYSLIIKDLPVGIYRVHVPMVFAGSRIFLNGRLMSTRGLVGTDAATTRYHWRSSDFFFEADGSDVELKYEVAAFLHRDNGIDGAPVIGLVDAMQSMFALRWAQELLFQAALMLLAVYSLVVYLFRTEDKPSLYHAIASTLFIPVSAMLGFDNMLLLLFPSMTFSVMLPLVYLSAAGAMVAFLSYAVSMFPKENTPWVYRSIVALIAGFFTLQVVTFLWSGTLLTSQINGKQVFIMLIVFAYMIVVLVRAVMRNRVGSMPFLIGMTALAVSIIMIQLVGSGAVPQDRMKGFNFTTYGILILLFSHLIVLSQRWSQAILTSEQSNEDLRELLDVNSSIASEMNLHSLLTRIVQVTSKMIKAERATLFIHDAKTDTLWSMVAEGMSTKEIRIAANEGLAGQCFQRGEAIITADPYSDPSFNQSVDEETGFRTRNVISIPIIARDGRRIGVMQALNRRGRSNFLKADLSRMKAFAAQAAIALDNATLFSEVIAARNFNESILQSMSSGVVTFQDSSKFARLNDAAARILMLSKDLAAKVSARRYIGRTNPWMLPEIEDVQTSGTPRSFLDRELMTSKGDIVSANISIVPLKVDRATTGALVMIDDISSNKRLEGAMRRFMTQEVMDQVLAQKDELLFGSACDASVLFADIRNFTTMAEKLSPRDVVVMLNEIFTDLFDAVSDADGVLDKYIGDAVMAVFGAPLTTGRDAANAVASALRMQEMIAVINTRRLARGDMELRLGVGISSGEVIAGTIGSPKRMDYTVIGDSVNLAARLQDITKTYGVDIIICEATANQLDSSILIRELDEIKVKGRERAERIYEVLIEPLPDGLAAAYDRGRAAFARGNRDGAVNAFRAALKLAPDDGPSAFMLRRAQEGGISR
jgi:adenylate cyclase